MSGDLRQKDILHDSFGQNVRLVQQGRHDILEGSQHLLVHVRPENRRRSGSILRSVERIHEPNDGKQSDEPILGQLFSAGKLHYEAYTADSCQAVQQVMVFRVIRYIGHARCLRRS